MLDWLPGIDRRCRLAHGLLLGVLLPAHALAVPPATPGVAALHDALALERVAAQAESSPGDARPVRVYVGMETEGLLVQEAVLTVADRKAVRIELGHQAAAALQAGGVLQLRDAWHGDGTVPLRVELLARKAGAGMSAHLVRVALETEYPPAAETPGLHLAVVRDGVFRRYVLQRRDWGTAP